ncbi:MAG TPA: hypothetical protein VIL27_08355 [Clostridia bacterium]
MKNTRKALSILGVAVVMALLVAVLVPATSVAAATVTSRSIRVADKRAEYQKFRQDLETHRQAILQNREQNAALIRTNKDLRLVLKGQLEAAKASLAPATDQLKAIRDQLKILMEELQATKGDIREITLGNQQMIRDLDYEALDASFAQIIAIQQLRFVKLSAINQLIQQMIGLVS